MRKIDACVFLLILLHSDLYLPEDKMHIFGQYSGSWVKEIKILSKL